MKTRVLLIDGNHEYRSYFAHRLRTCSQDYEVLEAVDGETGLHVYASDIVDCVVLDYSLPDVSSFSVLTRLVPRPRSPRVAVIVLTDTGLPQLSQLLISQGALACIPKVHTTGDALDMAIRKAIATIGPVRKDSPDIASL